LRDGRTKAKLFIILTVAYFDEQLRGMRGWREREIGRRGDGEIGDEGMEGKGDREMGRWGDGLDQEKRF